MNSAPKFSYARVTALCATLGFASLASAQTTTVTTVPVGAITVSVNAKSDQRFGITQLRPVLCAGIVNNSPTTSISTSSPIPSLGSSQNFIRFTSGTAQGEWFQVVSYTGNSISVAENLQSFGVLAGDKFEVRPFWTLSSLFPGGGGIPLSSDVFNPKGLVFLNDPQSTGINPSASAVYFYHDGTQGPAGWYNNNGTFANADNVVIPHECPVTIRNMISQPISASIVGDVPSVCVSNTVIARSAGAQDNVIYNPYPCAITLSNSNLISSQAVRASSNVFSPKDLVLVYSSSSTGYNSSAASIYFYHDGSQGPAGWYNNNGTFASADSVQLQPGAAFTIRKAGGASASNEWKPSLPYNL
ncbi:MAG: TIGR02597 family protein [Opitutus sp.]|nr:TIGR02597 family protein [Opitutus sp.]MCS6276534.1 TIGR02597 family protein [Opitutus sp.]MCS6301818.1 TIGR02597 family protein [Opitutus sp.]